MNESQEKVKQEIIAFINSRGRNFRLWYIGITDNPEEQLEKHNSHEFNNISIVRKLDTQQQAREVEEYFIEEMEMKWGFNGGKDRVYIYAYITSLATDEKA